METVTTTQLEAAFIDAIREIVPRYEPLRDVARWAYTERVGRQRGQANLGGHTTRSYTLIFARANATHIWKGGLGTAYAFRLAVATAYTGVDPVQLQHMLTEDGVDLMDALSRLRDPTVPGLCDIVEVGLQNEDADDLGNIYVEHVFTIHYHQATDF